MNTTAQEKELLREVIRGERPWADLQSIGICVTIDDERCQVDNPRHLSYAATLEDLAHGVLHLRGSPEALRRWAWFVQSSPSIYDLDIEANVRGECFLEVIWDLALGRNVSSKVVEMAIDLVGKGAE